MKFNSRKPTRLKEYDYGTEGAYFVTICTDKRKPLLGQSVVGRGLAPAVVKISEYGRIAEEQLLLLEKRYPQVKIDKYTIMPDHIHILLRIEKAGASPCPTIPDVMCAYKSITTRLCRQTGYTEKHLFQSSYHDHIIRNYEDYLDRWQYIQSNPAKLQDDEN